MSAPLCQQCAHSAIVIPVTDLEHTMDFYVNKVGFEVAFRWGDPFEYVVGKLGLQTQLHFTRAETITSYAVSLYSFVHNVNAVYDTLKKRSVKVANGIGDRDYGMRDFDIYDGNGWRLTFATSLDRLESQAD